MFLNYEKLINFETKRNFCILKINIIYTIEIIVLEVLLQNPNNHTGINKTNKYKIYIINIFRKVEEKKNDTR